MASGTVQFQSATLASPPAALAVMADSVNDTDHGAGTAQYIKIMDGRTAGTIKAAVTANGLEIDVTRVQGTVQALGTFQAHGTNQALGTVQPLAGSVHVANTAAVLGSVSAQGYVSNGAVAAGNPILFGGFGSSGTQAAVDDGDAVRLWADLNGRLQVRGTIDSMPTVTVTATNLDIRDLTSASDSVSVVGTVQTHGTSHVIGTVQAHGSIQVLGSVQTHGTSQIIGTVRFMDGSVHLAAGSVNAQGVIAHGAVIAGNPVLFGGFGSSGTQAAVDDGDLVRPWLDLNGRLQIRGTIDSMPTVTVTATNLDIRDLTSASDSVAVVGTVQTHGTSQVLGTVQAHGSIQVLGTVQTHGTSQVLGSVQGVGTFQVLGSVQAVGTTQTKEVRTVANPLGTRIAGTVGNLVLLAANASRLGASFYLESGSALFLKHGSLAGTFDYTIQLTAGALYELPFGYAGTISGIWQYASGTVMITENT
jgi:predicted acyltransferase (DUF342 family)